MPLFPKEMPLQRVFPAVHRSLLFSLSSRSRVRHGRFWPPHRRPAPPRRGRRTSRKSSAPFSRRTATSATARRSRRATCAWTLSSIDFDSPKIMGHWEEIMNRINSGDMPPDDVDKRPKPEDIARVAEWIAGPTARGRFGEATPPPASASPFASSRARNTPTPIHDLLGVNFDVTDPTGLPEDPDWHGIQRIGSVLTLSPAHVEKYLAAADSLLNEALSLGPAPKREVVHWSPFDMRGGGWKGLEKEYEARGIADKVRVDLVPNNGALDDRTINIKTAGEYLVRVKLSGLRPEGGRAAAPAALCGGHQPHAFRAGYRGAGGQAGDHRVPRAPARRPAPHPHRQFRARPEPRGAPLARQRHAERLHQPAGARAVADEVHRRRRQADPALPAPRLDRMGRPDRGFVADRHAPADFLRRRKRDQGPGLCARDHQPLRRARLPPPGDHGGTRPLREARREGATARRQFRELGEDRALRRALLEELPLSSRKARPTAPSPTLTDWELASRLSYFLWSSMPDEHLLDLARAGQAARARDAARRSAPHARRPEGRGICLELSRASGCNCAAWACSRRTRCSIPTTTSISRRA